MDEEHLRNHLGEAKKSMVWYGPATALPPTVLPPEDMNNAQYSLWESVFVSRTIFPTRYRDSATGESVLFQDYGELEGFGTYTSYQLTTYQQLPPFCHMPYYDLITLIDNKTNKSFNLELLMARRGKDIILYNALPDTSCGED